MTSLLRQAALVLIVLASAAAATAAPVRYTFSTDVLNAMATPLPLRGLLAGPVMGSLVYDAEVPLTTTFAIPPLGFGPGASALYTDALVSVEGTVNGLTFSDANGDNAIVSNDNFTLPPIVPPVPVDLFVLVSDPSAFGTAAPRSLSGFIIGDYVLVNVRLFWLETGVPGTVDFLSGQDLPAVPPGIPGRLALDFVTRAQFAAGASVPTPLAMFFDGLRVTRVQVPEPLALPIVALAALLLARRRRR